MLALPVSRAARADDFYAGKVLNIIAGFPPGGGVDGEMRVMTKYLAKYIPGNPTIVSRNMQGAGGIILGNHLYSVAAPDGLTLGMPGRSGFLLSNVVRQKNISYDLDEILLYRRRRQRRQCAVAAQANRHQHDRRPQELQEGVRDRRAQRALGKCDRAARAGNL